MNKQAFSLLIFLLTIASGFSQSKVLQVNGNISMLEDSLLSIELQNSLNEFLVLAQKPNNENYLVLQDESVETYILLDEFKNITKNENLDDSTFYKPYLTNLVELNKDEFLAQVSYIGIYENESILNASFDIIAHKKDDSFVFASPLVRNTQNWKTKTIENHIFYYPYNIDDEKVNEYVEWTIFYDEKLENNKGISHHFLCKDEIDPLKLVGVNYKSDYNGEDINQLWYLEEENKNLFVLNELRIYGFNTHDLWHNRLSKLISRRDVHRRVDCHIATLYGGLWGLSWEELFPMFHKNFVVGKNVDWLEHKNKKSHFLTNNGKRKNYSDDFVGALLIRKIEKEKGFDGVWELLKTKRNKEETEYFAVLEELTGITIEDYNAEVQKLIEAEINQPGS